MSITKKKFILSVDLSSSEEQTNDQGSKTELKEIDEPSINHYEEIITEKRRRRRLQKSIEKSSRENTKSQDKVSQTKNSRYERSLQKFIQQRQSMANKITFCGRNPNRRKSVCSNILEMSSTYLQMKRKEEPEKKSILRKKSYRFNLSEKMAERRSQPDKKVKFDIDEKCVPERKARFRSRLKNEAYPVLLRQSQQSITLSNPKQQRPKQIETSPKITQTQQPCKQIISSKPNIPRKQFSLKHLSKNQQILSIFTRDSSGMNFFSPEFDLYFRDDFKHALTAKKVIGPKFHYLISLDKSNTSDKNTPLFCGKIVGDFSSESYSIYVYKERRYSLVCTSIFKESGLEKAPKINQVYFLKQSIQYEFLEGIHSFESNESLDELYLRYGNKNKIHYLRSKIPEYQKEINQYTLNFGGRVSRASIKNFILEDPQTNEQVMMFGRGFGETFNLQFGWPLNLFVAFALTLPYFQNKS